MSCYHYSLPLLWRIGSMKHIAGLIFTLCGLAGFARAESSFNPIIDLGYASYTGTYNSDSEYVALDSSTS